MSLIIDNLRKTRMTAAIGFYLSVLMLFTVKNVQAATTEALNCAPAYQIIKTFPNKAKWEMCWEPRAGYGYRLNQVIFTPADGARTKILQSLHAAQLFVPYDDNGGRYHDITYGRNLTRLSENECPSGSLLTNSTLCLVNRTAGLSFKNAETGVSSQSQNFALYGYFWIGNYFYIFQYSFFDDGSIEPSVGASGSLQRFAGTLSTGMPVGKYIAVNHNHLVIWRMDFDVDGKNNNLVERISFTGSGSNQREIVVTPLTTETKETNNLANGTFWRVRNTASNNPDGRSVSYEIEPSVTDQLRAPENYTQNDFYLTQYNSTEEFGDIGLVGYVNGQALTDPVLWYGVNFHHVPRGEDDIRMPAHWQGFRIRPRDVAIAASTSSPTNRSPSITNPPGNQVSAVNALVKLPIQASDPDGDSLSYSATGLPPGLSINGSTGIIGGTTTAATGNYQVSVSVRDGRPGGLANSSFTWTVNATSGPQTLTFSATAPITIKDETASSPYPAAINISGISGTISKVAVEINGLSHTYGSDIDMLLVGPAGQKVMLMSDAGGGARINNATLTFDSSAGTLLSQSSISTGTFKPTNYAEYSDPFPAPAPTGPYLTDLSAFNGSSPNGQWRLFVFDDVRNDTGQIANGFSITIKTQ